MSPKYRLGGVSWPTRVESDQFRRWLAALLSGFAFIGSNVEDNDEHERRFRAYQNLH